MSAYHLMEWVVIALLLFVSLRVVWLRVLKPTLQKPKAACGSCNNCGTQS